MRLRGEREKEKKRKIGLRGEREKGKQRILKLSLFLLLSFILLA
jgi:hypothetical protein